MTIYTRTGDTGTTGLANGERVSKNSPLISFVGQLDEINAHLGLCVSHLKDVSEINFNSEIENLEKIQNNLFVIGSISVFAKLEFEIEKEVKFLEIQIDEYEKILPKLTNFILPGGHVIASQIHLLRTAVRKLEISAHSLNQEEIKIITPYLNRLSDYFFVMARFINFKLNIKEPIWKIN
jgi:cob(I)alamin adenosyltransferase